MKSSIIDTYKQLELSLANKSLLMDGHQLSKADCARVSNAYIMWCMCLCDAAEYLDMVLYSAPERGFRRSLSRRSVITNDLRAFAETDLKVVMTQQKAALQLLRHLPITGVNDYQYSKLCKEYGYCRALRCNYSMNILLNAVRRCPRHELFQAANDACQFISRLTLRDIDWIEDENIQAYKDFEDSLTQQEAEFGDVSNVDHAERENLISNMHSIVTEWFSDFEYEDVESQHGYGATNEVKRSQGTAEKYHHMLFSRDTALAAIELNWLPRNEVWPGLANAISDHSPGHLSRSETKDYAVTRIQLVPKGIDKKRVVSMDNTTNQFFQKILQDQISNHFDKHRDMHINLHKQDFNRDLAGLGSTNLRYGTADLSSASDSVTWSLVKRLFKDTPIYNIMVRTRTRVCELPDGTRMQMKKAYPMGSALCFPIECTVFSAVLAATNRQLGTHTYYRVYGDDMVIHARIWDQAIHNLKLLGFIVNDDKSFAPLYPFKESCGIECWDGYDVSPLRLSRKWDIVNARRCHHKGNGVSSSTALGALYDLGNQCFDRYYKTVRAYIIQETRLLYGEPLFSRNSSYGFKSNSADLNGNLKIRFTRDASPTAGHRGYYLVQGIKSRIDAGPEELRYSKLLDTYDTTKREHLVDHNDRIECACGAATTYVSKRLVPVEMTEMTDEQLESQNKLTSSFESLLYSACQHL